jgi:DNA repair protein RecO (recombination protein O)
VSETAQIEFEAVFLLHSRPYRESSRILEIMSQQHGRLGIVARGARRPKSKWRSVLQPFQPMRMSWFGRGSLQTLRAAETTSAALGLSNMSLMAGYYMNELLMTLLHRNDPHPELFAHYGAALAGLAAGDDVEPTLRRFELRLLAEIGYGLVTDRDAADGRPLQSDRWYRYQADQGPLPVAAGTGDEFTVNGAILAAIGAGDFELPGSLSIAKRLLREKIDWCLGGRALKTRQIIMAMRQEPS